MRKDEQEEIILFVLGVIPVIWLALLLAPYMNQGLFSAVAHLSDIMNSPFSIEWNEYSLKTCDRIYTDLSIIHRHLLFQQKKL